MTRQRYHLLFLLIFFIVTGVTSCRYKEGPIISFRTAENRLVGEWEVKSFFIDGIDKMSAYTDNCDCKIGFSVDKNTRSFHFNDCKPDNRNIYGSYEWKEIAEHRTSRTILIISTGALTDFSDTTLSFNSPFTYFGPIGNMITSEWNIYRLKKNEMKLVCMYNGLEYIVELTKYSDD